LSVINQMLKDLEQRQGETHSDNVATSIAVNAKKSPYQSLLMIIVTVVITLSAVYMFYLYSENERLASASEKGTNVDSLPQSILKSATIPKEISTQTILSKKRVITNAPKAETLADNVSVSQADNQFAVKAVVNKPLQIDSSVTAQKLATTMPKTQIIKQSSMVITRKQLTPETLTKQKINRAKEAVANNNITKAEQLFEEVLLISPNNKYARKQLAALWFGRQSYQAALNLLSQGIHLDINDSELRLLKAQIHSKLQQNLAAFEVLQAHPELSAINDIQYHSLLANQAQASQQYQFAIKAYLRLTQLQANLGRWWLGLGIAYDSESQFKLAKQAYYQALSKQDLSNSTRQFVSQRLVELGE